MHLQICLMLKGRHRQVQVTKNPHRRVHVLLLLLRGRNCIGSPMVSRWEMKLWTGESTFLPQLCLSLRMHMGIGQKCLHETLIFFKLQKISHLKKLLWWYTNFIDGERGGTAGCLSRCVVIWRINFDQIRVFGIKVDKFFVHGKTLNLDCPYNDNPMSFLYLLLIKNARKKYKSYNCLSESR